MQNLKNFKTSPADRKVALQIAHKKTMNKRPSILAIRKDYFGASQESL
jgi:hypothetical protein